MASEWQTAFDVSHKMPWCALITAIKNYNKSLEKLQDFFSKTETKTKTKCSRPRPRLSFFLSSRRLETKTLVSMTTSLHDKTVFHNTTPNMQHQDQDQQDHSVQDQTNFWSQTGLVLKPTASDHITGIDYMHVRN